MSREETKEQQYSHGHHHRKHHKKRKKNRALNVTLIILACLLILALMAFGTIKVIQHMGAKNLEANATTEAPELISPVTEEEAAQETEEKKEVTLDQSLKPGEVLYKGQKYAYNKDIRTFVILGIDCKGDMDALLKQKTGGQSDMIFLGIIDGYEKSIKLIGINRNTMTDVMRFDVNNEYVDTVRQQITLQHAYGTGGADSCERTVATIDKLMYMIPIHGYFSMNMGAIEKLNDAVGGIELTALETIPNTGIREGEKVTLLGKEAFSYVKYRDWKTAGTADKRLERQKQYLNAFVKKTMAMIKNDLSLPLNLFNIISNYAITDITIDQMTYLVSQAIGYSFEKENIYSIPGETVQSETTAYEEFIVDETALYEMILDIFYNPVE